MKTMHERDNDCETWNTVQATNAAAEISKSRRRMWTWLSIGAVATFFASLFSNIPSQ